ncbi:hypothetical protein GCM10009069_05650 [Algimonas arctica]|uniref:Glycosyltransferase 2-like domain-containing protein n=1 Tax=Algimonas arctica TaxID=1479486 RepID=A0A8J3CQA6_9PROT|nr:glycosyltransferase [Algimonas arctica]GHA85377.1 hypothetical protein GCM10009069_05650 [Algimonas arctica]
MPKPNAKPELSVIMCTYSPRPDLLVRSLRALASQTLDTSRYELIIVDNNSKPPLDKARLERLAGREIKLVVEMRQGLTFGRVCGFETARADRVCFIDDDNEINPAYLETVLAIAAMEPNLGVFGGICHGVLEGRAGWFKKSLLPHLGVRNIGLIERTGEGHEWGEHEPIGAGIVVRREVGQLYCDFVNNVASAAGLGRTDGQLLSGEDSLLSRMSALLGFPVAYRPDLQLRHHITAPRLKLKYLSKLMEGHGRSYVILQRIMGHNIPAVPTEGMTRRLIVNFRHRLKNNGIRHALSDVYWDIGYARQTRLEAAEGDTLVDFFDGWTAPSRTT